MLGVTHTQRGVIHERIIVAVDATGQFIHIFGEMASPNFFISYLPLESIDQIIIIYGIKMGIALGRKIFLSGDGNWTPLGM